LPAHKENMKEKLNFIINYLTASPKIAYRYYLLKKKKKNLIFNEFRPTNSVCINGSLNQLVWNLENFIFLTVSNSSKIYFNSNEYIFKCAENKTKFVLKVHTINGTKEFTTNIKVLSLTKKEFSPNVNKKPFSLKNKTHSIISNKKIDRVLSRKLNSKQNIKSNELIINQEFQNFSIIENKNKVKSVLIKINKTKSLIELENLKQKI
jgi:hypothetical protein